jgi:GDP-L-fucose synthase
MSKMMLGDRIFVAGHQGLVGSALLKRLREKEYSNILTQTRSELDLRNKNQVEEFFQKFQPEIVFIAAAKVGGILANNTYRADFIYENLEIQNNLIYLAHCYNVKRLVFLGSSCIYPSKIVRPIKESDLLTGPLERTNRPYAIAKIAGLELVHAIRTQHKKDFFSVMPTNLYGPKDNFHPENSHVLPGLIRRFHEAKKNNQPEVVVWGSGTPRREFLYSEDCADAIIFLAEKLAEDFFDSSGAGEESYSHINIGTGVDISILNLANLIKKVINFPGEIVFDLSKPDGTERKVLDVSMLQKMGWRYSVELESGISLAYEHFLHELAGKFDV